MRKFSPTKKKFGLEKISKWRNVKSFTKSRLAALPLWSPSVNQAIYFVDEKKFFSVRPAQS